jgi:hypothetical protein
VAEQVDVRAGAAPAVEQRRMCDASGRLAQERRHEPSKSLEPEMARFGKRRGAQEMLHASDCSDLALDCIDTQQSTL